MAELQGEMSISIVKWATQTYSLHKQLAHATGVNLGPVYDKLYIIITL